MPLSRDKLEAEGASKRAMRVNNNYQQLEQALRVHFE